MIRLTLYSRPGCHLCDLMREEVDAMLGDRPRKWEVIDVESDPELLARYGSSIPVLYVNGRLFAKILLPRMASKVRLLRTAAATAT